MPLFKKTIMEQVSPSTYELVMERVDQFIVSPIKEYTLSLDQESMAKFVEGNGLYVLSSLFLLCAIVICVFGRPVVTSSSEEIVEMKLKSPPKLHRKVPASISMDDSEVTELTTELMSSSSSASSSASSTTTEDADDDDASSTASSVECPEDDEDDHSVEETYDDFLKVISSDEMDVACHGEVVGQVYEAKVAFNDSDEDTALETPTSSPPSTPDRSYANVAATLVVAEDDAKSVSTTNTTSSRRASLKKRLSSSFKRTSSNSSLSGMFKRNSSSSSLSGMVKKSTSRLSLRKLDTTQENKE